MRLTMEHPRKGGNFTEVAELWCQGRYVATAEVPDAELIAAAVNKYETLTDRLKLVRRLLSDIQSSAAADPGIAHAVNLNLNRIRNLLDLER